MFIVVFVHFLQIDCQSSYAFTVASDPIRITPYKKRKFIYVKQREIIVHQIIEKKSFLKLS